MKPNAPHKSTRRWMLSVLPGTVWLSLFLALPFLLILGISFFSRGAYGEIERPLTFENYKRIAGFNEFGFEPLYPKALLRTCVVAGVTAMACAALSLPLAFFIASRRGPWRAVALTLVVIPIWTNLLIRTYAWQSLLGPGGLVTALLAHSGICQLQGGLYPGIIPVYLGLICDYLPFAVLPLYASVEKIDWTLAEAARDLGAHGLALFRHSILPQIRPGLWAGALLVFLPAIGQFVIPDLLGGAKTTLLGNLLQQQFGASRDWPFGAAITVVFLTLTLLGLFLYFRCVDSEKNESLGL